MRRRCEALAWIAVGLLAAAGFWWAGRTRNRPVPGRVSVTLYQPISPLEPFYRGEIAAFERLHPEIDVRVIWVPASEFNTKLKILAAAGRLPDVFTTGDVWLLYLLPFMRDITPLVRRDAAEIGLEDYFAEIRSAMRLDGRYYIVPESMNLSLLYFNRRLFQDAGQPEPSPDWTWKDLVRAGRALTRAPGPGRPAVWGVSRVENWWGQWLIYVRQSGGRLFSDDGLRCLLDSPEAVRGLRFFLEQSSRYGISAPAGFEPPNSFVNGQAAMLVGGHVSYWLNYNQVPGLDWDVQVLPAGPAARRGGELAIQGYSLGRDCGHPEEAWALVKYLTRPEAIAAIVRRGTLAVRRSVAAAALRQAGPGSRPRDLAAAYAQFKYGEPLPRHPDYIEILASLVQPEIDRMLLGRITPEEAGRRAAAAVNAYLAVFCRAPG